MKHYNVVAAVVCKDNRYLCVQRGKTKFEYTSFKWEFPGGKIESGETPQHALARELIEEMDYPIVVGDALITVHHEYPDFGITMTAYLCTPQSDTFHLNEHVAYRWCEKDELDGLDWAAADVGIVKSVCCR